MPVDQSRYPPEWKNIIVPRIAKRAAGRCECTGECGKHQGRCTARNHRPHPVTGSVSVFTTAHLGIAKADGSPGNKHDKSDCRDENLKHLCNFCHLNFDRDEHIANARATRRRRVIEAGQMEMEL